MKRLLFVVVGLLVSLNLAYANDLLLKASNGALNQNSVGVKKLTDKEMAQVKGGLELSYFFEPNGHYGSEIGLIDRNGRVLSYSVNYIVSLEEHEEKNQKIEGYGPGTARTNYWFFKNLADASKNEYPVIYINYNGSTGNISAIFGVLNVGTKVFRRVDTPLSNAILSRHGYDAAYYAINKDMIDYFNIRRFRYK